MATDGAVILLSDFGAPSQVTQDQAKPRCKGCNGPVKDHIGPHGLGKCMVGVINSVKERVELLEKALQEMECHHREEIQRICGVHDKRVDGLLATIDGFEQRIAALEKCT